MNKYKYFKYKYKYLNTHYSGGIRRKNINNSERDFSNSERQELILANEPGEYIDIFGLNSCIGVFVFLINKDNNIIEQILGLHYIGNEEFEREKCLLQEMVDYIRDKKNEYEVKINFYCNSLGIDGPSSSCRNTRNFFKVRRFFLPLKREGVNMVDSLIKGGKQARSFTVGDPWEEPGMYEF